MEPLFTKAKDLDVHLHSQLFKIDECNIILQQLIDEVNWTQDEVVVFNKTHKIPRLNAWYGDAGMKYKWSGNLMTPLPWTNLLLKIKHKVELVSEYNYNSVLLNYYRNGNDGMGYHADDEKELGENPTIASLSFGQERPFHFKHKYNKVLPTQKTLLQNGSLLIMKGTTQKFWKHALPKTKKPLAPRVNLTFRKIIN